MNNSTKAPKKAILVKIAESLLTAQRELDELALQLALGKSEAKQKFEEIKKEFKRKVTEVNRVLSTAPPKEFAIHLKSKIDELEILLSADKVETKYALEVQVNMILQALRDVEEELMSRFPTHKKKAQFAHEVEKFKLKLEILQLKFEVKKFKIKDSFRTGMNEASSIAHGLVKGAKVSLKTAKGGYADVRDEIQSAYKHMKKAIHNMWEIRPF